MLKRALWLLLGMILAVALFCLAVGIGCAVNGVTFNQQIIDWFTTSPTPPLDEAVDEVASILIK